MSKGIAKQWTDQFFKSTTPDNPNKNIIECQETIAQHGANIDLNEAIDLIFTPQTSNTTQESKLSIAAAITLAYQIQKFIPSNVLRSRKEEIIQFYDNISVREGLNEQGQERLIALKNSAIHKADQLNQRQHEQLIERWLSSEDLTEIKGQFFNLDIQKLASIAKEESSNKGKSQELLSSLLEYSLALDKTIETSETINNQRQAITDALTLPELVKTNKNSVLLNILRKIAQRDLAQTTPTKTKEAKSFLNYEIRKQGTLYLSTMGQEDYLKVLNTLIERKLSKYQKTLQEEAQDDKKAITREFTKSWIEQGARPEQLENILLNIDIDEFISIVKDQKDMGIEYRLVPLLPYIREKITSDNVDQYKIVADKIAIELHGRFTEISKEAELMQDFLTSEQQQQIIIRIESFEREKDLLKQKIANPQPPLPQTPDWSDVDEAIESTISSSPAPARRRLRFSPSPQNTDPKQKNVLTSGEIARAYGHIEDFIASGNVRYAQAAISEFCHVCSEGLDRSNHNMIYSCLQKMDMDSNVYNFIKEVASQEILSQLLKLSKKVESMFSETSMYEEHTGTPNNESSLPNARFRVVTTPIEDFRRNSQDQNKGHGGR